MSWIQSDFQYTEPEPYIPPTWADGTDAEIIEALEKHYNDEIDLTEYWSVGDERTISLSAIPTGDYAGETHVAQDVTFVILNVGGKELVTSINNHTECAFIVGQKEILNNNGTTEGGYMNSTSKNAGGWYSSPRRTWCNNTYYNAFPSSIISIFKQHYNVTAKNYSSTETTNAKDFFALAAIKEMLGTATGANATAESSLSQFEYYKTQSNRIKLYTYWTRSVYNTNTTSYCSINVSNGAQATSSASYSLGILPFGVI